MRDDTPSHPVPAPLQRIVSRIGVALVLVFSHSMAHAQALVAEGSSLVYIHWMSSGVARAPAASLELDRSKFRPQRGPLVEL